MRSLSGHASLIDVGGKKQSVSFQGKVMVGTAFNNFQQESRRQTERPHTFWDTQPVPSMSSESGAEGPLAQCLAQGGKNQLS